MKRQLLIGVISGLGLAPLALADELAEIFENQCADRHGRTARARRRWELAADKGSDQKRSRT
jgi:hypothetical protein